MYIDPQSQPHHQMVLENTHPSGAEEWHCSECNRRFLLQWPPSYKRIVMDAGNEYATHSASKGGLRMGPLQVGVGEDEDISLPDELRDALNDALDHINFDDWDQPSE